MKRICSRCSSSPSNYRSAITNPSKDVLISWPKEKLKSKSDNGVANWGTEVFGDRLISSVTETNNYVLFSFFTAKLSETENIKVLVIFDKFIPLSGPPEKASSKTVKSPESKVVMAIPVTTSDIEKSDK